MALRTLGTNASNSLSALVWNGMATPTADVAALNALILDDINSSHPVAQIGGVGGFVKEGFLYVPNRAGPLELRPGDIVATDGTSGQVILLTSYGLSAGPWTLT
jgi:hypothetical protein